MVSERQLDGGERDELEGLIHAGLELLGGLPEVGDFFPESCDDSSEVVASIRKFVDAFRERGEPSRSEEVAYAVGTLWGDEVHKTLGWSWVVLSAGDSQLAAVVSPDRAVAIRPQLYLYRLLAQRESDNTTLLLFNMLKAGQRLPGAAGSYTELG